MNIQCLAETAWKASKGSCYCYKGEMYEKGDCAFQRVVPIDSTEEINY